MTVNEKPLNEKSIEENSDELANFFRTKIASYIFFLKDNDVDEQTIFKTISMVLGKILGGHLAQIGELYDNNTQIEHENYIASIVDQTKEEDKKIFKEIFGLITSAIDNGTIDELLIPNSDTNDYAVLKINLDSPSLNDNHNPNIIKGNNTRH